AASCACTVAATAGCGTSTPRPPSGRAVFASECSVCHSLNGRYDPRRQGGDLRDLHATRAELLQFAIEMPAPDRPLSRGQLAAVVAYIYRVERGRG
ncbi:MAG: c-type cytochrome, partial [Actinocrinis sp.]